MVVPLKGLDDLQVLRINQFSFPSVGISDWKERASIPKTTLTLKSNQSPSVDLAAAPLWETKKPEIHDVE